MPTRASRHPASNAAMTIFSLVFGGSIAAATVGLVVVLVVVLVSTGCAERSASVPPGRAAQAEPTAAAPATMANSTVVLGAEELLDGIPGTGPLALEEIEAWLDDPATLAPLDIRLPEWLKPGAGQVKDLSANPLTRGRIELGRQLFFDPRLSADNSVSCASCHEPDRGFTVGTRFATGVGGQQGTRNPPALLNRIMLAVGDDKQMWDGRAVSVEDALLHALADPTEMAADPSRLTAKLGGIPGYRLQFDRLYGEVTWDAIGDAVGAFVHCLVTGNSPYDHAVAWRSYAQLDDDLLAKDPTLAARHAAARQAAESQPLSAAAVRGEQLFFGTGAWCSACHNGVNFTDEQFHNIGVGLNAEQPDLGRFRVTGRGEDWAAFKTPTIRNAIHTAPYMHDGSLATLEDVVDWYAHAGQANRNLDYRYAWVGTVTLSDQDKQDLVAFMRACTGPLPRVETGRLPE
jgi:cytochrome c peroxidase